ncbi:hypothetical protein [Solitalea lacus]|uniref:hypothetical protein n=1 Tax=Solitalea lacus TaxID=2911172 RepID=UPI001EDAF168|nr:hypothetical protein [Solitalea lacus]UKJ06252.1 hypothetical protein L2B55_11965 [Solitalea lacus]
MKLISTKSLILASALALTFTACKKDENPDPQSSEVSAVDNQAADDLSTDVFDQFNMTIQEKNYTTSSAFSKSVEETTPNLTTRKTSGIVTIVPTPGTIFPVKITIDFGTGTPDPNNANIIRKGKIVGTLTNYWMVKDAELRVEMVDYYVNGVQVTGTKTFTSNGFNQTTNCFSYKVKVDRARISEDGKTFTWSAERTVSYFTSGTPLDLRDDYITLTGSTSGINRRGVEFTTTITTELKKPVISRWIVSGVIEHKSSKLPTITLDYGNGTIDNKATLTVNGKTTEITLRK